jgi:hypothetical protein
MFWHHRNINQIPCGAVVDIGSGSVGIALVVVEPGEKAPMLIWSHREYSLLRTSATLKESERLLQTALVNAFLELSNAGLKALVEYNPELTITEVQVSIAAPWQYTNSKTVTFSDEVPFVVDKQLLKDLTKLAEDQALEQVGAISNLSELKLEVISQASIGVTLDGYRISDYEGHKATELAFVHLVTLTTESLSQSIHEYASKIAPRAVVHMQPFMFNFFKTIDYLYPHTLEACLIDITNEATEIAIIRDGTLRQVNHIAIGSFTIARKIAETLAIPAEEAYTYLKSGTEYGIAAMPEKIREKVNGVFDSYQEELSTMFKNTGDDLLIPFSLFVHTDVNTQHFFNTTIKKAAKMTTGGEHIIHPVTARLVSDSHEGDTAILLNVQRFYQEHHSIHSEK